MNEKKSTKVQEARETALLLLLGFIVAAYLKCDVNLYFGFAATLVGKTGIFMWGKSKEYSANTAVEVAKTQSAAP
jgi:hypothetical protein